MAESALRPPLKQGSYGTAERVIPRRQPGATDVQHAQAIEVSPPTVRIGEMVLFYRDANPNTTPHNAFVAAVEGVTLILDVMEASGMKQRRGVRWLGDPRAATQNMRRWGAWMPATTVLHERVSALEEAVALLMADREKRIAASNKAKTPPVAAQ